MGGSVDYKAKNQEHISKLGMDGSLQICANLAKEAAATKKTTFSKKKVGHQLEMADQQDAKR